MRIAINVYDYLRSVLEPQGQRREALNEIPAAEDSPMKMTRSCGRSHEPEA